MEIRFYLSADTDLPHVLDHGIEPREVIEAFFARQYDLAEKKDGTRVAEGQTRAGRYLRIIYRKLDEDVIFVITAYELRGKAKLAYRRRRRKGR